MSETRATCGTCRHPVISRPPPGAGLALGAMIGGTGLLIALAVLLSGGGIGWALLTWFGAGFLGLALTALPAKPPAQSRRCAPRRCPFRPTPRRYVNV